jgi:plastocyanin
MKRIALVALLAASACALFLPAELSAAVVMGKVMFLTKRGQSPVANETLVWLDPVSGAKPWKRPPSAFTMTTRNKAFLPHVMAVPAGSTVSFPNEDPIAHNLFSLSPGNTFDLGLYRKGPGKPHTFDAPGTVSVYCNVHPNMSAVVHVMATPYYGFADTQGNYSFDVPAGRYRVTAWNEQGGTATSELVVASDGKVQGATLLTIDGRNFRLAGDHTNKYGQPYRATREY